MKVINSINSIIKKIISAVCVILVGLMTIIIFLQIICRLVATPLLWSEEASRIMMIWLVMLGSALLYDMPKNGHIKVDLIEGAIPEKVKPWLGLFIRICVLIIIAISIKAGFDLCSTSWKVKSTALDVPFPYIYGAIPVSFVIMVWFSIVRVLNKIFKIDIKETEEVVSEIS